MKIVIYDDARKVLEVIEDVDNVSIVENNISWRDGQLRDFKQKFLLVDDVIEVETEISDDLQSLDRKAEFIQLDLKEENRRLKERLTFAEDAILFLMDRS